MEMLADHMPSSSIVTDKSRPCSVEGLQPHPGTFVHGHGIIILFGTLHTGGTAHLVL